jgi:uroporphyrin-III C-methyltransferase / precorrin-2 dehydrogenase / sirohydrochlorin ferrochelatase
VTDPAYYPVFLDLWGKRVVVVGGGEIAAGKLPLLLESGAEVTVIAERAVAGVEEAAERGEVARLRRPFQPGDLGGARLAIDASDDAATNRLVREDADRERVPLNVVDRTPLCDWIAPAVVNRGPLKIAISTSGESPFLASALRRRLEMTFGEEWDRFTRMVGHLRRRLRARGVPPPEQERIYRRALRSEIRSLLRAGRDEEADDVFARLESGPLPGRVTIAGAGPGAPELLTEVVRDALFAADVVFHDALVQPEVLDHRGPRTELVDVGRRAGGRDRSQESVNGLLVEAARAGRDAVRLKGGDPFVFGRGGEEVAALAEAGVEVTVLPGISSATAAPTLAGIPLTMRGVASSVAFSTAHLSDGPARLHELARNVDTLVILMAFQRAPEIARELAPVLGEDRPAAVIACASTPRQRVLTSTLGQLPAALESARLEPPALMVVGEVVRSRRAPCP